MIKSHTITRGYKGGRCEKQGELSDELLCLNFSREQHAAIALALDTDDTFELVYLQPMLEQPPGLVSPVAVALPSDLHVLNSIMSPLVLTVHTNGQSA